MMEYHDKRRLNGEIVIKTNPVAGLFFCVDILL